MKSYVGPETLLDTEWSDWKIIPPPLAAFSFVKTSLRIVILVARFPDLNVAVAADAELMAVLPTQLNAIQARLGLQRIVAVDAHVDEILEDQLDIAAAVIDDRQVRGRGTPGPLPRPRAEVGPPVVGREEHRLPIGHVAPDHHAVQQSVGRLDLGFQAIQIELADAVDRLAHPLGVQSPIHIIVFSCPIIRVRHSLHSPMLP